MGKRNLETAVASLPSSVPPVSVGWKPFLLRPNMPPDGVEKGPGNRVNDRLKQAWLPDGYSRIFISYVFGPLCLKDNGSATLRCKI